MTYPRSKAVCDRRVMQAITAGSQTLREHKLFKVKV